MRRLLALCAVLLVAADWPQWLGPNRDGSSPEVVKPWKDAPKVVWRAPVGEGHSSPIVAEKLVLLHFSEQKAGSVWEILRAYDAEIGTVKSEWQLPRRDEFSSPFGTGPRSTPLFRDGFVYTLDVTGMLNWFSLDAGKLMHRGGRHLLKNHAAPNLKFGVSASPLAVDDNIVVPVGGKGASLVAIDPRPKPPHQDQPGMIRWQTLDDPASYASPILIDHAGHSEVVALTANAVVGVSAKDGKLFWRFPFKDLLSESSTTPVKVGDLLIASSVTLGSVGLKLTTADGKPTVEQAWKNSQLPCYFSTPVAVGKDHIYMVTGSLAAIMRRQPQADLCCVETATGKILWKKEKVGKYHAALLRTGDNKLLMHCDSGDLVLIDPDPKEYRELSRSKVCGETWAHPALADGRLYVRDDKELICLKGAE
jgi:outer membrane protein assembly factor BamB